MKKLLLPILFCVATLTFGQTEVEEKPDYPNAKNSYLSFDLSTPINIIAPRYRFGYIHSLNERWRIGADIGFGSENTTWKVIEDYENDDYLLLEGRAELYHILNPTRRVNMYISGEVYFIHHKEVYYDGEFETANEDIHIRYNRADFRRQKYGFNLKFGVFVPFGNKVGMNAYIGAGPRIRDVEFSNLVNPNEFTDYNDEDEWGWWDSHFQKEGAKVGFNFALGLKFFYRLQ